MMWKTFKETILNLIWPKRCINCGKENSYLCQDCFALIEILRETYPIKTSYLDGLFAATAYKEKLVQAAIHLLKYNHAKEVSESLASLIIAHFKLLDNYPDFSNAVLCAVPLHKSKLKERNFNQAEKIAEHLSKALAIPLVPDLLLKTKKTLPQMTLSKEERLKNVLDAFEINHQKQKEIIGKNVFLIDDVFTTGATMEECARILKQNRAQSVRGVVAARD